jgi:hypothetical protein
MCKERNQCPDCDCRSVGHFSFHVIARALEHVLQKPTEQRPAKNHDSPGHGSYHQSDEQLAGTDLGPDGSGQLDVTGSHATHPEKKAIKQEPQGEASKTLA